MADKDHFVRFEKVDKSYDGKVLVVKGLDLDIAKGEFITMLGPSGSGKTTCLMMLAGFETATNGKIYLDNNEISNIPPHKRGIGMVFYENLGVADDDAFGYQFIIGINTPINKNAKLGVEYRYFSSTDPEVKDITGDVDIHSFGFKLQYYWDSPAKKGRKKSR